VLRARALVCASIGFVGLAGCGGSTGTAADAGAPESGIPAPTPPRPDTLPPPRPAADAGPVDAGADGAMLLEDDASSTRDEGSGAAIGTRTLQSGC
jgi:hypothetical protein